ncbi:MAG TPA: lytic murein transglycosylase [Solirubrobacteraceae bacterium]|nr:lytic murein transglycosylase [Solirubrobacteraceae bacterium]
MSPTRPNAEAKHKPAKATSEVSGANNVAASPQAVAASAALAAMLGSSGASAQALAFYRIPLFLLPIYKAAAVQYGVPWQILAAINEIETDYGSDQSVSSAGAVGWMQFMPATWLQYGVDALNAGYADPYNPVDAVFAAARYLRAAGAQHDLRAAILAYNHSEEYVDSVMLRAKLISSYPSAVIATLTGLIDARLPVTGKQIAWGPLPTAPAPVSGVGATGASGAASGGAPGTNAGVPGSSAAPSPAAAAAAATSKPAAVVQPLQLVDLRSAPQASVVAVQDGRIEQLGASARLGKYLVLRDVYGDVFTYAGLGSIAASYTPANTPRPPLRSGVVEAASTRDPAPSLPASAGTQSPLTLRVKAPRTPRVPSASGAGRVSSPLGAQEEAPAGMGRVRLFAHPGNPDARAAAAENAAIDARRAGAASRMPLRRGSVVTSGTVLGRVNVALGAKDGHLRFAIRPAGDPGTIDPGPILANWAQLQAALHPQGARALNALLGATASDVFLLSEGQLERAVLADPGITVYPCGRREIAAGAIDRRILALLAFLSRSGLEPTVSALRCGHSRITPSGAPGAQRDGLSVSIAAVNDIPIAGHQGSGTITDLTIRTLLTLPSEFIPSQITSLMRYPGAANTHADAAHWDRVQLQFTPAAPAAALSATATDTTAHSAGTGPTAPSPIVTTNALSAAQWNQLMARAAALPAPTIAAKRSSSAIPDPKRP